MPLSVTRKMFHIHHMHKFNIKCHNAVPIEHFKYSLDSQLSHAMNFGVSMPSALYIVILHYLYVIDNRDLLLIYIIAKTTS